MKAIVAAIVMLAGPALAGPAKPTCTRAGRGATAVLVAWDLQVRHAKTFDRALATRCRADMWSAAVIACFAALADVPHERVGRASEQCVRAMTVPQKKRLRDAIRDELTRLDRQGARLATGRH